MIRIDLTPQPHTVKIGDECPTFQPNVTDDCIFYADGKPIGFFMQSLPERAAKLADLANTELLSDNVPKSSMDRKPTDGFDEAKGVYKYKNIVKQWSVVLGSTPPKPHMRRPYASISSVHSVKSAQSFIKAMLMLAKESEAIIADILPEQHQRQADLFKQVPDKWKFGNLFTSSISNFNISAPFHRDNGNIHDAVNVIITKRRNSTGGNLHVPDYNATIDQCDNSILVYPAWRNVHGVTPIIPTHKGGYRNSLVFYPLKAFVGLQ